MSLPPALGLHPDFGAPGAVHAWARALPAGAPATAAACADAEATLTRALAAVQGLLQAELTKHSAAFVAGAAAVGESGGDVARAATAVAAARSRLAAAAASAAAGTREGAARLALAKRRQRLARAAAAVAALRRAVGLSAALAPPPRAAHASAHAAAARAAAAAAAAVNALPPGIQLATLLTARAASARVAARRGLASALAAALLPSFDEAATTSVATAYDDAGEAAEFGGAAAAVFEGAAVRAAAAAASAAPAPRPLPLADALRALPPAARDRAVQGVAAAAQGVLAAAAAAAEWAARALPTAAPALARARDRALESVGIIVTDMLAASAPDSAAALAAAASLAGTAAARSAVAAFAGRLLPLAARDFAKRAFADAAAARTAAAVDAAARSAATALGRAASLARLAPDAAPAATALAPLAAVVDGFVAGVLSWAGPAPLAELVRAGSGAADDAPPGTALTPDDAPPRLCARLAKALGAGGVLEGVSLPAPSESAPPPPTATPPSLTRASAIMASLNRVSIGLHKPPPPAIPLADRVAAAAALAMLAASPPPPFPRPSPLANQAASIMSSAAEAGDAVLRAGARAALPLDAVGGGAAATRLDAPSAATVACMRAPQWAEKLDDGLRRLAEACAGVLPADAARVWAHAASLAAGALADGVAASDGRVTSAGRAALQAAAAAVGRPLAARAPPPPGAADAAAAAAKAVADFVAAFALESAPAIAAWAASRPDLGRAHAARVAGAAAEARRLSGAERVAFMRAAGAGG